MTARRPAPLVVFGVVSGDVDPALPERGLDRDTAQVVDGQTAVEVRHHRIHRVLGCRTTEPLPGRLQGQATAHPQRQAWDQAIPSRVA